MNRYLDGHKIIDTVINYPKAFEGDVIKTLSKVKNIRRFAKVLVIDLDNNYSIVIQIKLTGQLIYKGPNLRADKPVSNKVLGGVPGKHTHVIFNLDKGGILYYNDVRKFGRIKVKKTSDVETSGFIGKLGPEPLKDLNLNIFYKIVKKSKKPIKILLMDQEKLAGVGNIYANDALWESRINPRSISSSLERKEVNALFKAVEYVLSEGIKSRGASELAFVAPDGGEGEYQNKSPVYGREGKPCKRCGSKISKIKLGGRGTYFCPKCQKDPAGR